MEKSSYASDADGLVEYVNTTDAAFMESGYGESRMENVFAEILLGGLGVVIVILSFTKWSRNKLVTLVIGAWFLAMAVSLFCDWSLVFTILLGEPFGIFTVGMGIAKIVSFIRAQQKWTALPAGAAFILVGLGFMYTPVMVWQTM